MLRYRQKTIKDYAGGQGTAGVGQRLTGYDRSSCKNTAL
jgi:hypothetical protein